MSDITQHAKGADFDLRDQVTAFPLEIGKLGLIAPARPRLALKDFILDGAPAPPPAVHRSHLELVPQGHLQCWLNTRLGDCVPEMVLHSIEMFHADAGTPVPKFMTSDAEQLYELMAGWDPKNSEATDQGTDETVAMQKWEQGFKLSDGNEHKIAGTVEVDPKNITEVKRAIWDCVCPQIAIEMPVSAQNQMNEWAVTDPSLSGRAAPGSWGGHGIPYFSYDEKRLRLATWGGELLESWEFHSAYVVQVHCVITQEMLNRSGVSPAGINWSALNAALREL